MQKCLQNFTQIPLYVPIVCAAWFNVCFGNPCFRIQSFFAVISVFEELFRAINPLILVILSLR